MDHETRRTAPVNPDHKMYKKWSFSPRTIVTHRPLTIVTHRPLTISTHRPLTIGTHRPLTIGTQQSFIADTNHFRVHHVFITDP